MTKTSSLIIAGDWNATLNPLDKQGGLTWKEPNYRNSLVHFIKEANVVDIFRELHPKNKSYTYESVVVGHGPQSMMGLSIDSSSVAMNLRTVRISKSE